MYVLSLSTSLIPPRDVLCECSVPALMGHLLPNMCCLAQGHYIKLCVFTITIVFFIAGGLNFRKSGWVGGETCHKQKSNGAVNYTLFEQSYKYVSHCKGLHMLWIASQACGSAADTLVCLGAERGLSIGNVLYGASVQYFQHFREAATNWFGQVSCPCNAGSG